MFKKTLIAALLSVASLAAYAADYYVVVPFKNRVAAPVIAVQLNSAQLPDAIQGMPYAGFDLNAVLSVTGDSSFTGSGVTWSVVSSTLPDGLSLRSDGIIAGTPSVSGTGSLTARATYKGAKGEQSYVVQVAEATHTGSLTADTSTDFGQVQVLSTATRSFTFKNTGNSPLSSLYPTLVGSGLVLDSANSTCGTQASPIVLAPNANCVVKVKYAPATEGVLAGSLSLGSYASIGLAGTAIAAGDPAFGNVTFLMSADGSLSDLSSAHVGLASTGTVTLSNSAKFGSGSAGFNGSGYLSATSGISGFDMSTASAWTMEGWVKADAAQNGGAYAHRILAISRNSSSSEWESIAIALSGSTIRASLNGAPTASFTIGHISGTIVSNAWTHFALVFTGSSYQFYVNGSLAGKIDTTAKVYGSIGAVRLGVDSSLSSSTMLYGNLDDVRVTKNVARYTSNFTVPSKAFTAY